jgi:hypothetical protein
MYVHVYIYLNLHIYTYLHIYMYTHIYKCIIEYIYVVDTCNHINIFIHEDVRYRGKAEMKSGRTII